MADKQVVLYKLGKTYLAFPPVLLDKGGNKIEFVNSTGDRVYVMLLDAGAEPCTEIPAHEKARIQTKGQNPPMKVYSYTIGKAPCPKFMRKKKKLLKRLDGGSDPILILEN